MYDEIITRLAPWRFTNTSKAYLEEEYFNI